jgi:excisionase family DNA binding protein
VSEKPTTALFVRIPQAQARALDRLAFESRRHKQAVVSELLERGIGEQLAGAVGERVARSVDRHMQRATARASGLGAGPTATAEHPTAAPEHHAAAAKPATGEPADRRVTIETIQEPATVVGRHAFRAFEPDVLTLEEVAELLAVEPAAVAELAASGELPGRRIGEHWRFARSAVLGWLAHGAAGVAVPDHAED